MGMRLNKSLQQLVLVFCYAAGRVVALLILVLLLPVLVALYIASWITLGEQPFFSQQRVGLNGKLFRVYKVRTVPSQEGLPIPKLCQSFRLIHVDELPQLLNIVLGQMAIVGPRPHVPEHVAQYLPWQRNRLKVKPGLTCIRQLLSPKQKLQFNQHLELDIKYIDTWSPLLDLQILWQSVRMGVAFIK